MSKTTTPKNKRDQFVNTKGPSKSIYVAIAAVAILVMVGIGFYMRSSSAPAVAQADPREAKYIGRYLPSGYEEVKLTEPIKFDKRIDMTDITPQIQGGKILITAGDIISNRIVYFEYTRPSDKQIISMMAYIKPSGKLFTGVSLCPPCQAKRQYYDVDGMLTCGSCATKREPESQVGLSGACKLYPFDEMPHKLVGDKIQIAESDLAKWTSQPLDRPVGGQ
ncbi:MAG: Fe-S-containing protein [Candidatus Aquicultor sp.]